MSAKKTNAKPRRMATSDAELSDKARSKKRSTYDNLTDLFLYLAFGSGLAAFLSACVFFSARNKAWSISDLMGEATERGMTVVAGVVMAVAGAVLLLSLSLSAYLQNVVRKVDAAEHDETKRVFSAIRRSLAEDPSLTAEVERLGASDGGLGATLRALLSVMEPYDAVRWLITPRADLDGRAAIDVLRVSASEFSSGAQNVLRAVDKDVTAWHSAAQVSALEDAKTNVF